MKIAIYTSNSVRHKYVANTLASHADEALIISECKKHDTAESENPETLTPLVAQNLKERYESEVAFFKGNDTFRAPVLPILWKEINLNYVYETVKEFAPDMIFVYGAFIIKEPLISLLPPGRTINMHLGLSPYYRGAGTNFWPFINKELEYVGATLLHLDPGIDTGDIIAHVRPSIEKGDTLHEIGNKVIREGTAGLVRLMDVVKSGKELSRTPQWEVPNEKYYETKQITEEVTAQYYHNIENGLVDDYLSHTPDELKVVPLP